MASEQHITQISTNLEGIAHVLRDRPLAVPIFQRSYAWRKEHVEAYWQDLRAAMTLANPEYFLGAIVVTPDNGRLTIIDGQQRMATTTLLLAAIRNVFITTGDENRATVLERDYIASRSLRTGDLEPRLHLNPDDQSFFSDLVLKHPGVSQPAEPQHDSHSRMLDCFNFLTEAIEKEVEAAGTNWANRLFDFVDFLENRVRVIVVRVPNEADAFLIFETLNYRGLDLTIADLLKNYLFGLAREEIDLVQKYWRSALAVLERAWEEQVFTDFIRHYWSSKQGATRERELYSSLKRRIKSKEQSIDLVALLEASAPNYAALLDFRHGQWSELGLEVNGLPETLLRLGLEQNRPLLLAAMDSFDRHELSRLLQALIAWSVRGLIVGGIGGGTFERYYSLAAVDIDRGKARVTQDVFERLSPIIPTDEVFEKAFAVRRINSSRLARYYLLAIEKAILGEERPAIVTANEELLFNADLVLPRRANPESWPLFPSDALNQWALRLGNQFIFPRETARVSGEEWLTKREALRGLNRPLAERVVEFEHWDPATIELLQQEQASHAADIWPRRPE